MKTTRLLRALLASLLCLPGTLALAQPGPPPGPEGNLGTVDGREIYERLCQGCHMPGGAGARGAAAYPSFVDNPALASSRYMAVTILAGRGNMPAFDLYAQEPDFFEPAFLTDEQVANVVNYIRTSFGNQYDDPISAEDVRALRPHPGE